MKPISTSVHGILDYVSVGALLAAPRLFGWNSAVRQLLSVAALGTLGYSLMTRYGLGLIKALPMQAHLALDAASGALLCAAPLSSARPKAAFSPRRRSRASGLRYDVAPADEPGDRDRPTAAA
jgi:hypothetical protein